VPPRSATVRSRELESEATRRTILSAAETLLARGGEDGLSIREVCARAGVTPPTIYHHFGDKDALVDRVVDDTFAAFDHALAQNRAAAPADPVDALRWGLDRYVDYGVAHPAHYRLMFFRRSGRPTPSGLASYDRLRRLVAAVADAGRLGIDVELATRTAWCTVHGATSLIVCGYVKPDDPAVALLRDGLIAQLTRPAPPRATRVAGSRKERAHEDARVRRESVPPGQLRPVAHGGRRRRSRGDRRDPA
jgi:AcrR family transcriptional regulator